MVLNSLIKIYSLDLFHDDFHIFLQSSGVCDATSWREICSRDARLDDFKSGFALAKEAGEKPVFEQEWGEEKFYFIGTEKEILSKLGKELKAWLKEHPPEERIAAELAKQEEQARKQLKEAQSRLKEVKREKSKTFKR